MIKLDTLLDAFSPPDGMVGHSAVLVAMTGEEDFLDELMQRFTRLRARQRSQLGLVTTYLLLDPHGTPTRTGVLPPGRVPGLHELTPRLVDPASLLHAKLGLLAFSPSRAGVPTHLRLVVQTANYTYASAMQQLELVWTLDVPLNEPSPAEDRADLAASASFLEELIARRFYRDEQRVPRKQRRLTARLDALLDAVARLKPSSSRPRFVHSLTTCLYDQIRACFEREFDTRRNLLLCGSGFYEEPSGQPRKPAILTKLEAIDVFTSKMTRVALVEPDEAGAIALWAKAGNTDGWTIARPTDALDRNRKLHAKFIYAGYLRDGHLSNGWLYLGSGNLSRRGLLTTAKVSSGNIECGVVLGVPERLDDDDYLRVLFWSPDAPGIKPDEWHEGRVGDAPEVLAVLSPAPILSGSIVVESSPLLRLLWRDDVPNDIQVSVSWTGVEWIRLSRAQASLPLEVDKPAPIALRVRDETTTQEWTVPVVDASGRVSWQPPAYDTFDDVLAALLDFPIRPSDETSEDDDEVDGSGGGGWDGSSDGRTNEAASKTYALHAAAALIEKTAALQRALEPGMLDDWFEHLDRMFRASFPKALVATWRGHRINVFAHLRELELRPQEMTDKQRVRYFDVLDRAAIAWGVA